MLFFKVYNLILIASEPAAADELQIDDHNYLLVRLLVTDLNDHQPRFDESKYTFYLNETTTAESSKQHYSATTTTTTTASSSSSRTVAHEMAVRHYTALLNATCARLRARIQVRAHDLDEGVNAVIKYKISHQKHFRNTAAAAAAVGNGGDKLALIGNNEDRFFHTESELDDLDASFHIDERTGSVGLHVCRRLSDDESYNLVSQILITKSAALFFGHRLPKTWLNFPKLDMF